MSRTVPSKADVVIIGGGVMGLSVAYQLKRRKADLGVMVFERHSSLGFGSSGYSTGFQRAFYSLDETMRLALDGIHAHKNWTHYLRDPEARAYFTTTGALWMMGASRSKNERMQKRLARFGVKSDILDEQDLCQRFPLISPEPFPSYNEEGDLVEQNLGDLSVLYEYGCGYMDAMDTLEDLLRACRRDGVDVRFRTPVRAFETTGEGSRCTGVTLDDGSRVEAGIAVVNAAGPWFNKLNETVGVKLSTTALPTRIQVAHKYIPDEYCELPFTADSWGPSGIYFMPRRQNKQLIFGSVDLRFESEIVDPDNFNDRLDSDIKQEFLFCLQHRLPGLKKAGEIVGFSSLYTVNQDDLHPIVGETHCQGLWACNGFSGHGFKLSPAIGSLVGQQITGLRTNEWETDVPLDFLGPHRKPHSLETRTHFA